MQWVDYVVIGAYFAVVIGLGFWYQKRASESLEAYFLGGQRLHWLALSMSGSVSTFDITGTMWIVTLITLFGMKSMWNHWMWGFLMGAFFLSYMGKWVRRSGVVTGAEWMVTRFGDARAGKTARTAYALMAVLTQAAFIGYAFQGIGKFASVYVDFGLGEQANVRICASTVFAATTLYVLLGGLFSVVVTDVIQTVILTGASILIAVVAYTALTPAAMAKVPEGFASLLPTWRLENVSALPKDYALYELFGAMVIVWVLKGFLLNSGGPGQMYDFQRFLAARDAREAAKVGATWSLFLIVRWAMAMGIALLALTGVARVTDPEKVMPAVLRDDLPMGVRGLVVAGLLAAFMSTFSSTVNSGASYIVRDLYQPLLRRRAGRKHLLVASYVSTVLIVVIGLIIGFQAGSIREVFDWIMMALGGAFVIPNVLRWYWWRLNGWGYAAGTLAGMAAALAVPFVGVLHLPYVSFPLICGLSVAGCLVGTFATRPTEEGVLVGFFRIVRPFGAWGPVRAKSGLAPADLAARGEGLALAALNVLLASTAVIGLYLAPMYLVGHWHGYAAICFGIAAGAGALLYFTWYRRLPPPERDADDSATAPPE